MDQLIVGDAGCEYDAIIRALRESATSSQLIKKLDEIAMELSISSVECDTNVTRSILKIGSHWSSLKSYLESWREKEGANATLLKLIEILKRHNLNNSAHVLENKFQDAGPGSSAVGFAYSANIESDVPRVRCTNLWNVTPWDHLLIKKNVVFPKERVQFENPNALLLPQDSPKGNACIINILKYANPEENRDGAIADTHNMENLWRDLEFNVTTHDGKDGKLLTEAQISEILETFKNKCIQEKVKSMVVFIGCHGMDGVIETADGKLMNIKEKIVDKMTMCTGDETMKQEWAKVIKIFIIQACRGDPYDETVEHDPNAIVCYSTCKGVGAHRLNAYVKHLTEVLMENAWKMDFVKMLEEVEKKVWEQYKNTDVKQKPVHDILRGFKTFYFNLKPTG